MNKNGLGFIYDNAIKRFNETPVYAKLKDDTLILDHSDLVALAYYQSVVLYLIKMGVLSQDFDLQIEYIEENSDTKEDDYG